MLLSKFIDSQIEPDNTLSGVKQSGSTSTVKRNSGLRISGVFILLFVLCIALVFLVATPPHHDSTKSTVSGSNLKTKKVDFSVSTKSNNVSTPTLSTVSTNYNDQQPVQSSNTDISISSNSDSTSSQVNVNGQNISVPTNGSKQQTISNPGGGTTTVNINQNTGQTGQSTSTTGTTDNTFLSVTSSTISNEGGQQ